MSRLKAYATAHPRVFTLLRYVLMTVRYGVALAMLAVAVVLASAIVAVLVAGLPFTTKAIGVYGAGVVLSGWVAWCCWPGILPVLDDPVDEPPPATRPLREVVRAPWNAEAASLEATYMAPSFRPPHDYPLRPSVPVMPGPAARDPLERTIRDVVARHPAQPVDPAGEASDCARCGGLVVSTVVGWRHSRDEQTTLKVIIADAETFPGGAE